MTGEEGRKRGEFEQLRCMAWNINGWRGEKGDRKINKITGEVRKYDVFVLTETHLEDEENEKKAFNKYFEEYHVYHAHRKEQASQRCGVAIGIRKTKVEEKDIEFEREAEGEGGRWVRATIRGVMEEELHIWGIYAPTVATDRKVWMRKVGERIKKKKGIRVVAGDFNFVMDTKLDKIGGNKKKGTEGRDEQRNWEVEMGVVDIWRKVNPGMVGTTWRSRGKKEEKRVRTRIDRTLVDKKIIERTTEVRINRTKTSDHDVITWTLETKVERSKRPFQRIPVEILDDEEYQTEVRKIFEEERGGGRENVDRFKQRCVDKAIEMWRRKKKKKKRNNNKLNKRIEQMRRIIEWTENARIDVAARRKIRRYRRGVEMLRKSNTMMWMGKKIGEIDRLEEVEEKAEMYLDKLIEEREEGDEKRRRVERNMEILREVEEDERSTRSFFGRLKKAHQKEEIFALVEATGSEAGEVERRGKKDIQRIATTYYKELWSKRRVSNRIKMEMINKIKRRVSEIEKEVLEREIQLDEVEETVKKMKKGKATGVDGVPAEFYQKFDFVVKWLHEVYREMMEKGEMTETMKTSVVKLLFKKNDRKKIENYRPISLLTVDYKILAKILTERMKKVLKKVIGNEQQGFIPDGDIAGNLLLVKEIIAYCEEEEVEGFMIMMDFEKAYDRVDRGVMLETLRSMNFGEKFIRMVELLYEGSVARVIVNGEMAIEMRESKEVEGIRMNKEDIIIQNADKIEERENRVEGGDNRAEDPAMKMMGELAARLRTLISRTAREAGNEIRSNSNNNIISINHNNNHSNIVRNPLVAALAAWAASSANGDNRGRRGGESTKAKQADRPTPIVSSHSQRQKQQDTDDDRISMYADDSSSLISRPEQVRKAREIVSRYERATGGKLHEGKTMVMPIGKTRLRQMTNKQLDVKYSMMGEEDREVYLGDLMGNGITEEERFGKILEAIEKTGQKWNKEDIGIYGQSLVANTLLLSKISHRASVNPLSPQIRKAITEKFKAFIWKGEAKRGKVRWEVLMRKEEEGGVGLRDPVCALDAAKINILVNLMTKDRQPWMRWIERKLVRVAERWRVAEAMAAKPNKQQVKELKQNCIVESTLKVWFEVGGTGGGPKEEVQMKRGEKKTVRLSGIGMETERGWIPIERLKGRQIYDRLVRTRLTLKNYKPSEAHKTVKTIQKMLTAKERDYWWRLTHRVTPIKKKESKWRRGEDGELVSATCPVCKEEEETWDHYDYECSGVRRMNEKVAAWIGRDPFSKEEWRLEKQKMERQEILIIAKARWIYHCERCKMDMGRRRKLNIEVLMNRLERRVRVVKGAAEEAAVKAVFEAARARQKKE